jgi:hypothetical protein
MAGGTLTLYQIGEQFQALEELLELTSGEVTPELQAWLDEYSLKERDKVDGYGQFYESQKAIVEACKQEEDRLRARRKAAENKMDRLKFLAGHVMALQGLKKLEGNKHFIRRQAAGGKLPLILNVDPKDLPAEFQKVTIEANNDALRLALEEDRLPTFAFPAPEQAVGAAIVFEDRPVAHLGERSIVTVIG